VLCETILMKCEWRYVNDNEKKNTKNLNWTRKKSTYTLIINTGIQQLQSTYKIGKVEAEWIIVQQEDNKITQKRKRNTLTTKSSKVAPQSLLYFCEPSL
jgi:hypothetical protein